jgi:hypothetical protein
MGVRKRETADARKEANKSIAFMKLNNLLHLEKTLSSGLGKRSEGRKST